MIVTVDEFKSGIDRYLELVDDEEIVITKNGRKVASLTGNPASKAALIRSLIGTLPPDVTKEEAREARLAKYENSL